MTQAVPTPVDLSSLRASRIIWPLALWPARDREAWIHARLGIGPAGRDNPSPGWCAPTLKNNEVGYGRYLSWLHRGGILVEDEAVTTRITEDRLARFTTDLQATVSSCSVATSISTLALAARALAPDADWSWLSRRSTRLKRKVQPSRDKRHAIQHTLELYRLGKQIMDTADRGKPNVSTAHRYQSGLMIALLAARPLRIRNFQAIALGTSLRWDGRRYWLTFSAADTKTGGAIDEPVPDDLTLYLETFLRGWRPILVRQANKRSGDALHRRLWVNRYGAPMREATLRHAIEVHTKRHFGTAVWPHLFRDCLLTSVAVDSPDLMAISATLLGHARLEAGQKHYNQARMLDASRRFAACMSELREDMLCVLRAE